MHRMSLILCYLCDKNVLGALTLRLQWRLIRSAQCGAPPSACGACGAISTSRAITSRNRWPIAVGHLFRVLANNLQQSAIHLAVQLSRPRIAGTR